MSIYIIHFFFSMICPIGNNESIRYFWVPISHCITWRGLNFPFISIIICNLSLYLSWKFSSTSVFYLTNLESMRLVVFFFIVIVTSLLFLLKPTNYSVFHSLLISHKVKPISFFSCNRLQILLKALLSIFFLFFFPNLYYYLYLDRPLLSFNNYFPIHNTSPPFSSILYLTLTPLSILSPPFSLLSLFFF